MDDPDVVFRRAEKSDGSSQPTGSPAASLSPRALPAVSRLIATREFQALMAVHPRGDVLRATRRELDRLRHAARDGRLEPGDAGTEAIHRRVSDALAEARQPYYRRVINATGVILHTALGRAVLAPEVADVVRLASMYPLRVEVDLESGNRGGRDEGCTSLLADLTSCEAATVVNNNAAATLLMLAALARGKRVLVSHGELVEIGGSFRVPEIMAESGAVLVAVGTTNRTHLSDYVKALDADTGLILKVHTSNYRISGFTSEVTVDELVALGRTHNVPVAHDLGSGLLADLPAFDRDEPRIASSLRSGADVVCFSGDKLLGGPQAGILAGTRAAIERCRTHPLYRTMRPGRLVYAALEATLRIYREGDEAASSRIPVLKRLLESDTDLLKRARRLAKGIATIGDYAVETVRCASQAGSGSLPARDLPSRGVSVKPRAHSAERVARALRIGDPSILCRLSEGALLMDVRTIDDDECGAIVERLRAIANTHVS